MAKPIIGNFLIERGTRANHIGFCINRMVLFTRAKIFPEFPKIVRHKPDNLGNPILVRVENIIFFLADFV